MKIEKVLNLWCKAGEHNKCPAISKGSKSDPVTFVCICECHKVKGIGETEERSPRKEIK